MKPKIGHLRKESFGTLNIHQASKLFLLILFLIKCAILCRALLVKVNFCMTFDFNKTPSIDSQKEDN